MRDCVAAHVAQEQANGASSDGEQKAFGEHLTEDAHASRAEGEANAHFALAAAGASEQEVGEIGAGKEQDESGERDEHIDGLGQVAAYLVLTLAAVFKKQLRNF